MVNTFEGFTSGYLKLPIYMNYNGKVKNFDTGNCQIHNHSFGKTLELSEHVKREDKSLNDELWDT